MVLAYSFALLSFLEGNLFIIIFSLIEFILSIAASTRTLLLFPMNNYPSKEQNCYSYSGCKPKFSYILEY